MNKTLQTLRYLSKAFMGMTCIGFLSILIGAVIVDLIYYLIHHNNPAQPFLPRAAPFEFTAGVFALLTGILLLIAHFKVTIANGISRKTFLRANLLAAALSAAALAIFDLAAVQAHSLLWPVVLFSDLAYPQISWFGTLVLQFSLLFLSIVAGWFVTMAYYRSSTPVRWAISLAPFMLFGLVVMVNAQSDGTVFRAIGEYLRVSRGLSLARPNPYVASVFMLAYSGILAGLVYLLIRRAPIKN